MSTIRVSTREFRESAVGLVLVEGLSATSGVRELEAEVRIHTESRRMYGSPKITRELPKLGLAAHRNTVSRIMQECGIRAKHVRNYRPTTTQSAHAPSPGLLERDFTADGPNKKWLCDITYIATDEGFLYLAGVMDAWSRRNWDGHGVEHVEHAACDDCDRCAHDGREAQVSTDWPCASQRSRCARWMSCKPRTSRGAWHGAEHEPCRQLLRQRH